VLTIHGPYRASELGDLLDRYGVQVVLFPSAAPESFSYTLSEAWALERPAVVPPFGALAERVAATGAGWILEDAYDADRILDALVAILSPRQAAELAVRRRKAGLAGGVSVREMATATASSYAGLAEGTDTRAAPERRARSRMLEGARAAEGATYRPPSPSVFASRPLPGRNDRCPCGSGLRYRHCCAAIDEVNAGRYHDELVVAEAMRRHHAGRVDAAVRLYRSVLERDAGHPPALHYLGMARWQSGEWKDAEPLLRQSIAARPGDADFHSNLGLVLQSLGRHDEAVAEFRHALQLRPEHAQATNNLGLSLMRLREFDAAGECFRRALALAPDFREARWNLEVALRAQPSDG
jgi:tetratricopeptide (TPR) repeat protein